MPIAKCSKDSISSSLSGINLILKFFLIKPLTLLCNCSLLFLVMVAYAPEIVSPYGEQVHITEELCASKLAQLWRKPRFCAK